jgi:hypothetical protein
VANAILLVVAILLPTLVAGAMIAVARVWRRFEERGHGPVAMVPPIERIAADLRRLNSQRTELLSQAPGPGRGVRARAVTAAYVDVLTSACRVLEVPPPQVRGPGRSATLEIDRVESELRIRGLDVGGGE